MVAYIQELITHEFGILRLIYFSDEWMKTWYSQSV